jgi:hypothetical protein
LNMKMYRCLFDDKIITEKAISKGVCAGHQLVEFKGEEKVYQVAVGIPNEGQTKPEAYDNHLVNCFRLGGLQERWRYEKRNPRYEFSWFTASRMLTQMAREKLMSVAIEAGMDYIVMYDDDMLLPPDMILRLIEDMEAHPVIDILAPLAFMRAAPHYAVMYSVKEGYDPIRKLDYYINHWVIDYPKDKLVECDAVGFGAVVIKMSMVKKMKPPYFMSTTATGEDIFFCVNAKKQANARVFMDTRIKLGHLGDPILVDEPYFKQFTIVHKTDIPRTKYKYATDEFDITNDLMALDR